MEEQIRRAIILYERKKISLSELYLELRDIEKTNGDISEMIKKYADISLQLLLVTYARTEPEL